jgi:hypothetical protein
MPYAQNMCVENIVNRNMSELPIVKVRERMPLVSLFIHSGLRKAIHVKSCHFLFSFGLTQYNSTRGNSFERHIHVSRWGIIGLLFLAA